MTTTPCTIPVTWNRLLTFMQEVENRLSICINLHQQEVNPLNTYESANHELLVASEPSFLESRPFSIDGYGDDFDQENGYNPETQKEPLHVTPTGTYENILATLIEDESNTLSEIETFIGIAGENGDSDVNWLDPESHNYLQDRVDNAIAFIQSSIIMLPIIGQPTASFGACLHQLLWTMWEEQGRKYYAQCLFEQEQLTPI